MPGIKWQFGNIQTAKALGLMAPARASGVKPGPGGPLSGCEAPAKDTGKGGGDTYRFVFLGGVDWSRVHGHQGDYLTRVEIRGNEREREREGV